MWAALSVLLWPYAYPIQNGDGPCTCGGIHPERLEPTSPMEVVLPFVYRTFDKYGVTYGQFSTSFLQANASKSQIELRFQVLGTVVVRSLLVPRVASHGHWRRIQQNVSTCSEDGVRKCTETSTCLPHNPHVLIFLVAMRNPKVVKSDELQ